MIRLSQPTVESTNTANELDTDMPCSKVSIIIPAYNEEQGIGDIITRVNELYPEAEIIVVNDGSTDNTAIVAQEAGATSALKVTLTVLSSVASTLVTTSVST